MKRLLAILLAAVLIFSLSACKKTDAGPDDGKGDPETDATAFTMQLLYCANDSFNPYALTSEVNSELSELMFDPLIKLSNDFEPIFALAESAENDGTEVWKLTLRDVHFTDGTPLSADDVIYSFSLAKNCGRYSAALSEVSSVTGSGKNVSFTLKRIDRYFLNILTFPIIKSGSDNAKTSDSENVPPVGTGRYMFNESRTELIKNERYYGKVSNVSSIKLINSPDSESVAHHVEIGATDMYYAGLNDGNITRMSGKKATVNRNNLVYLGMNLSNGLLSNIYLRYALSTALSRDKIVLTAYYGNAVAANGPFHPAWKETASSQTIETSANSQIAIENLEKIGYNNTDKDGYRINGSGNRISLSLLVNSDNQSRMTAAELIKNQLKAVGIEINVVSLPYGAYMSALNNRQFQLYLAEVKLTDNMDISGLVLPGGSAAYGITESNAETAADATVKTDGDDSFNTGNIISVINSFYAGQTGISEVITSVQSQMLIIPVCYRMGVLFYNDSLSDIKEISQTDLFFSMDGFEIISEGEEL